MLPSSLGRGQGQCQTHGSEEPGNGNRPGVSQGVPEEESSSFPSSLLSQKMNICPQSGRAIWPSRRGMGRICSMYIWEYIYGIYKGTPPWKKTPSRVTCPSPLPPDVQAEKEKKDIQGVEKR